MTKEQYIPKNVEKTFIDPTGFVKVYFHTSEISGEPCAIAYTGKKSKPAFNFRFKTSEQRESFVQDKLNYILENHARNEAYKLQQRLDRTEGAEKYSKEIKVGDLFCYTFSYNMTFNHFYQVVRLVKGRKIEVVKISYEYVSGDGHCGSVVAVPVSGEELKNKTPIEARVVGNKSISVEGKVAQYTTVEQKHYENHLD
jgi:hypothetical protein